MRRKVESRKLPLPKPQGWRMNGVKFNDSCFGACFDDTDGWLSQKMDGKIDKIVPKILQN